jgi:aspartate aminotransferase-like enzyme
MISPWEKVVGVCRKYGVLSLVDGAHSIGQHKIDVGASKCDFFVTVSKGAFDQDDTDGTRMLTSGYTRKL